MEPSAVVLVEPAALSPVLAKDSQNGAVAFATDVDSAEKGTIVTVTVTVPIDTNRPAATSSTVPPAPPIPNPQQLPEQEEHSNTGANRYAEVREAVDGVIKKLADQENTSVPILLNSPTHSTTTSSADSNIEETIDTEENSPECDNEEQAKVVDTGLDRIIERNYESYPEGWPQLAAFLNSADNYAIFRRFGTAHCRVLLHLMAEITSIEKQLDAMDESDVKDEKMHYRLHTNNWKEGGDTTQNDLLEELRRKLSEYGALLLQDTKLRELDSPPRRDFLHVFRWIYDNKPLALGEYDFILHRDDFVSSNQRPYNPFDRLIESCLSRWPKAPLHIFMGDNAQVQGAEDPSVYFFSRSKIILVGKIIAICLAVTILLIPIFLLYLTDLSRGEVAGMVLAFVLMFAMLMSLFTGAGVEVVFVGSCTYCAVLVTFMGNVQGGLVSGSE